MFARVHIGIAVVTVFPSWALIVKITIAIGVLVGRTRSADSVLAGVMVGARVAVVAIRVKQAFHTSIVVFVTNRSWICTWVASARLATTILACLHTITEQSIIAIGILEAIDALTTYSMDALRAHLANIPALPAVLRVPVEVRAGTATIRVAHNAPALAIGAVGVLDASVVAQAAVAVVVLQVHAIAGAGSQAVLGTRVDFVVGAADQKNYGRHDANKK
jgi:hypothetical protein